MKKIILFLMCLPILALAHVIEYDNGDIYTVGDDEYVFVSKKSELWYKQTYNNGKTVQFKKITPWTEVDKPPPVVNPNPIGTKEWCESHDLHANGYTFEDQYWYRACDTNNDGEYNICDWYEPTGEASFTEQEWEDTCNDGEPWDGES